MAISLKKFLHKLHNQKRFDVINSKWLYPDACAISRIFKNSEIPHVTAGLGSDINYQFKDAHKKNKILHMLDLADAAIVVSGSLKDTLVEAGATDSKITVIHNGVDTSQFTPGDRTRSRNDLGIDQRRNAFLLTESTHKYN